MNEKEFIELKAGDRFEFQGRTYRKMNNYGEQFGIYNTKNEKGRWVNIPLHTNVKPLRKE